MVRGTAQRKVHGGKLVRLTIEHDGAVSTRAELSGDFFIYPEEDLAVLESAMTGTRVDIKEKDLTEIMTGVIERHHTKVLGFAPEDLSALFREAVE